MKEIESGVSQWYVAGQMQNKSQNERSRLVINWAFTMVRVRHSSRLPTEALQSPSLAVFKACLDKALGSLGRSRWWPCLDRRLDQMTSRSSFQPKLLVNFFPCIRMHSLVLIYNGLQPEEAQFSVLVVLNYLNTCTGVSWASLSFLPEFQSRVGVN